MSKLLLFMFIHLILYYRYFLDVFCKQCHDAYFVIMNREVLAGAALMPPVVYDTTSHRDPRKYLNIPKTPIVQDAYVHKYSDINGFHRLMDQLKDRSSHWMVYVCSQKAVWDKIKVELNMPKMHLPYELLMSLITEHLCIYYPLKVDPIKTMVIRSYLDPKLKDFMKEFATQNNINVHEYIFPIGAVSNK